MISGRFLFFRRQFGPERGDIHCIFETCYKLTSVFHAYFYFHQLKYYIDFLQNPYLIIIHRFILKYCMKCTKEKEYLVVLSISSILPLCLEKLGCYHKGTSNFYIFIILFYSILKMYIFIDTEILHGFYCLCDICRWLCAKVFL